MTIRQKPFQRQIRPMLPIILAAGLSVTAICFGSSPIAEAGQTGYQTLEELGEALFFDPDLSKNRTQACATCHDPEFAFTDPRETEAGRAVSLGDDGSSLGDRNTPTAAYARFSPEFHRGEDGLYVGGQFLDGRAPDLESQAGGPPLNPVEMGMPDKASVVERLRANPDYVTGFDNLFGKGTLGDTERAYGAMTRAIASFERTPAFSPIDSKYDRYLRGETTLSDEEELGRLLFFSSQFTNCHLCHQLHKSPISSEETFTNYRFHNIGVPVNKAARAINGTAADKVDGGLLEHPDIDDPAETGKFKVPTLRNVAITGPYMHNGVFENLFTAVAFYNKYNTRKPSGQINPETGEPWGAPEVSGTISLKELEHGPALDDRRINALVAFLKTLTDRRYEHLLTE